MRQVQQAKEQQARRGLQVEMKANRTYRQVLRERLKQLHLRGFNIFEEGVFYVAHINALCELSKGWYDEERERERDVRGFR